MALKHRNKVETYGSNENGQTLLIDPLRAYATKRLQLDSVPVDVDIARELMNSPEKIDKSLLVSGIGAQTDPILIAENFSKVGETEIVDGNHTYVRFAMALELALVKGLSMDPSAASAPAYLIGEEIWRDFLADPSTKAPINRTAIEKRLRGIKQDFGPHLSGARRKRGSRKPLFRA